MTGSASNAMDVLVRCDSLFIGEGFREGMALGFFSDSRLADDGKRIYAMDVLCTCESLFQG